MDNKKNLMYWSIGTLLLLCIAIYPNIVYAIINNSGISYIITSIIFACPIMDVLRCYNCINNYVHYRFDNDRFIQGLSSARRYIINHKNESTRGRRILQYQLKRSVQMDSIDHMLRSWMLPLSNKKQTYT